LEGSQLSHHYSGPNFGFPHGDAGLALTDLYAFPKPGDAAKSILIMNVRPSASYNPPGPTPADPFSTEALYEFKIDTDGDAVADLTYQVQFSAAAGGARIAALRRVESTQTTPNGGQVSVDAAPVSMARAAQITEAGECRFFAGWRSEPFFFDANGAMNHLRFTGDNFFADKPVFDHSLEHAADYAPEEATRVARALLPDILIYDSKLAASYPENGRTLTDDVVDVFLSVLINRKVTGDNVGRHHDLLTEFPYPGPPHNNDSGS
jgi:hypothetical protein